MRKARSADGNVLGLHEDGFKNEIWKVPANCRTISLLLCRI